MFRPNHTCQLYKIAGLNEFGERSFAAPISVDCGVVKFNVESEKTSVRADSSASRGKAEEVTADVKVLFPMIVPIEKGDVALIHGVFLEVTSVFPRQAVTGAFDHKECTFKVHPGVE